MSVVAASVSSQACVRLAPDSSHDRCWLRQVRCFALASRSRAALGAVGIGGYQAPLHHWASSIPQAVAHSVPAAVLGSMVAPLNLCDHCLTTHSSRRRFAARLNSGVRPQGKSRERPNQQVPHRRRRTEWRCSTDTSCVLSSGRATLPPLGRWRTDGATSRWGQLVPNNCHARDRHRLGHLGCVRTLGRGRILAVSATSNSPYGDHRCLHRSRCGVRPGYGLLPWQQPHFLGRELGDMSRHWSGAPCWASTVVGQAASACGLTIHSSRTRFTGRLNSGVR